MQQTNTNMLRGVTDRFKSRRTLVRRLGYGLVAVVVFAAGVLVGQGRLGFTAGYSSVNGGLPSRLDYGSVNEVYDLLKQNYDGKLTEDQLLNGLKAGLADATNDPYTEYFTAAEAKTFDNELNNSFSGIGAELGKDKAGNLIVVSPIAGFPAYKAGLQPQDVITAINGQTVNDVSVDTAVNKIRGKAGTVVTLQVVRGGTQQLTFHITRKDIQVPSVSHQILDGNIGYIRITTFADDTSDLISKAADSLAAAHVKGVILDLRDNPGGLLTAAISTSSQWLDPGTTVLQEKRGSTVVQTYTASGNDPLHGIPTVVLVNDGSASASEITAGALHDNKAATIIGVKTFGKGVVQELLNLKDGGELKVTIASWYRPNGQNINKKGITPDQVVQPGKDDAPGGSDAQKAAAIQFLQNKQ